ncbi:MAG: Trm112 family protein [Candidatus Omnitrophota bacterium]
MNRTIDKELLKILACPVCKSGVVPEDDRIACRKCGRIYRIDNGIPVMLADEATLRGGQKGGDLS